MNKNYYQILQIDRNASPEIIEKAYKTLAKKYHPDLQEETNKKHSEEILKQINEAYEILSNPDRRKEYDTSIINSSISQEELNNLYKENQLLKNRLYELQKKTKNMNIRNEPNNIQENTQNNTSSFNQNFNSSYYEERIKTAQQQAYYDAYIQDLKNRGYRIKYKKNFSELLKFIFALSIAILFFLLMVQIPFIKSFFYDLFKDNTILKSLVNTIKN